MNFLGKNKKTTILGLLTIGGALIHAAAMHYTGQPVDIPTLIASITAGVGLISAKDGSTHSTVAEVETATNQPKA